MKEQDLRKLIFKTISKGWVTYGGFETDKATDCVYKLITEQLNLPVVGQQSELLFCDFCKEENPHKKHVHKKMKECEGCGLITKL